jgi:hypothetical protein
MENDTKIQSSIEDKAAIALAMTMPSASKDNYEDKMAFFESWCLSNNVSSDRFTDPKVHLAFFNDRMEERLVAGTLPS